MCWMLSVKLWCRHTDRQVDGSYSIVVWCMSPHHSELADHRPAHSYVTHQLECSVVRCIHVSLLYSLCLHRYCTQDDGTNTDGCIQCGLVKKEDVCSPLSELDLRGVSLTKGRSLHRRNSFSNGTNCIALTLMINSNSFWHCCNTHCERTPNIL